MTEIQIKADQNLEILIGTEANLNQANKYNAGTVGKYVTLGGNAKVLRRRMKNEDDSANAVTEEVHDALLLVVDSPLDDWVFGFRSFVSYHSTPRNHTELCCR